MSHSTHNGDEDIGDPLLNRRALAVALFAAAAAVGLGMAATRFADELRPSSTVPVPSEAVSDRPKEETVDASPSAPAPLRATATNTPVRAVVVPLPPEADIGGHLVEVSLGRVVSLWASPESGRIAGFSQNGRLLFYERVAKSPSGTWVTEIYQIDLAEPSIQPMKLADGM